MPTGKRVFTGTRTDGHVTFYKDRHGSPLARKPGGRLTYPKTQIIKNVFDDMDEILVTFIIERHGKFYKKQEVTTIGTKVKDLKLYDPTKRHYIHMGNNVDLLLTGHQVLVDETMLFVR